MRQLYEAMDNLNKKLDSIVNFLEAITHPKQLMETTAEVILIYMPIVAIIITLFWMITKSRKILNALYFTFAISLVIKLSVVAHMTWLLVCLVAALIIIKIVGIAS